MSVPFVTAAIEMSDPFLNREANGIQLYAETLRSTHFLVNLFFLFRDMDEEYPCLVKDYAIPATPPPKLPSPTIFSADWFRKVTPRPMLPPFLQLRFPLNIVSNPQTPTHVP